MIAFIDGTVAEVLEGALVVECAGMGYLVQVSGAVVSRVALGENLRLFTLMQIRENDLSLVGFLSRDDVRIFGLLTSVSGVGVKAALAILTVLDTPKIILAILTEEVDQLSRAQGVGKKLAQRIVLELRDKLKKSGDEFAAAADTQQIVSPDSAARQDAVDALLSLGYSRSEALRAVMEILPEGLSAEQLIRQALRKLTRA